MCHSPGPSPARCAAYLALWQGGFCQLVQPNLHSYNSCCKVAHSYRHRAKFAAFCRSSAASAWIGKRSPERRPRRHCCGTSKCSTPAAWQCLPCLAFMASSPARANTSLMVAQEQKQEISVSPDLEERTTGTRVRHPVHSKIAPHSSCGQDCFLSALGRLIGRAGLLPTFAHDRTCQRRSPARPLQPAGSMQQAGPTTLQQLLRLKSGVASSCRTPARTRRTRLLLRSSSISSRSSKVPRNTFQLPQPCPQSSQTCFILGFACWSQLCSPTSLLQQPLPSCTLSRSRGLHIWAWHPSPPVGLRTAAPHVSCAGSPASHTWLLLVRRFRVAGAAQCLPACQDVGKKQNKRKKATLALHCALFALCALLTLMWVPYSWPAKPLFAAHSMHMGQDSRHRPGDRHKPTSGRNSTKRQKKETSVSSVRSRPASHSGRYKKGARAGRWAQHVSQATKTPSLEPTQLAKELADTKALLAWEQGRRLSLEGSQANEKAMRQMLRDARLFVHKLGSLGEMTTAATKVLLERLRP